jgi:putative oxidoreductase
MLASIFVAQGADALTHPDPLVHPARPVTDQVGPVLRGIHPRLPTDARSLVQLNATAMVAGGLLLLTPLRRAAAVAIMAALVPTTLAGHPYWSIDDPAQRGQQRTQFLKNLGLLGGLLLAAGDTEGRPGLRWRAGHLLTDANRSLHREARQARARVRAATAGAAIGRRRPGK